MTHWEIWIGLVWVGGATILDCMVGTARLVHKREFPGPVAFCLMLLWILFILDTIWSVWP